MGSVRACVRAGSEFVQSVESRNFVCLSQRRIVENRVAEIFQRAAQGHRGLTDVHDLGGAVADHMHAQDLESVGIEEKFQQTLVISEHLAFGQFGVARQSDFVGNLFFRELFFGVADHGNLGDRINAAGDEIGNHFAGLAEHVATGEAALLHGGAGERGEADDVSGGVDVVHAGLKIFVDHHFAAAIGLQSGGFDLQLITVGLPADGVEEPLPMDVFSAFEAGEDAVAFGVEAYGNYLFAQAENGSELTQLETQALHNFAIHEVEQGWALIEKSDFHSQGGEHGSEFEPDDAGPHNYEFAWHLLQTVDRVGIEDALAVHGDIDAVGGTCAAGNHDVMTAQKLRSIFAFDFDGVGIEETGIALKGGDLVASKLGCNDFDFARHDGLRSKHQIGHGDTIFEDVVATVETALAKAAQVEDGFAQRFAGNGSGVHTNAADGFLAVNDGDFFAQFGGADCALLPRRTAADHYQVVLVDIHEAGFPLSSRNSTIVSASRRLGALVSNSSSKRNLIPVLEAAWQTTRQ